MTTRQFNIVGAVIFALFGVICFVGGFVNWIHFVFAYVCFGLVRIALKDNSDGKSIMEELKEKRTAIRSRA